MYTLLAIYVLALAALYIFQRSFLYFPAGTYLTPAAAGADKSFTEITVKTGDGLDLKGWYAPATTKPYTLVFFHGNADRLETSAGLALPFIGSGYGFLLAEYRGYSGMPGHPTETGLYADARAFIEALHAAGVADKNIVLFAHSLGTGVAVQMAVEYKPAGIILMSPFMSIAKMAQIRFPIFPAEFLARDRFENFKKITLVKCPLLEGHGGKDRVVPLSQGQKLFALANEPKEFHLFPEAGHNDLFDYGFADISLAWLQHLPAN